MVAQVTPAARETVSVLMTDLVGSTAVAGRVGPAAAEELRSEHFELLRRALERTGGREVKNLGDGLMVVFHGASQALTCAVLMQQAIEARNHRSAEPLEVRIGVSLGEATAEDGDYFGEPVIESARLCAEAHGGQIVVNDLIRRLGGTREGHAFLSLGGLDLKGLSEPVQAFELRWQPVLASGIELPERLRELPATSYVGRLAERERLAELWGEASQGSLRLALIGGEAGVGKTRLSTHLALEAHGQGAPVLYGRCDEDLGVPYQPWVQALSHLVSEAPELVLDTHIEGHGGDLARLVPALGQRVANLPPPSQSDPETERYLLYAAAAGLLEAAGEQKPLLLILDDLQWADGPTLSLLRHVVSAGASIPAMVVGTYRDSELSHDHPLTALLADLHREQGVERLKLTGLLTEDVLALMEAAAGHELDRDGQALAEEITRETAGNPFFAAELLRHLTESGAIVEEAGRWRLVGHVAELGLPQSVYEVIGRRVERLGSDARTALSGAAVIGRDFEMDLLLAVVDLPEAQLLDLLDEAVSASLLRESSEQAGRFTFVHALVEHALYEDLGRTRRARLHRRVAEALEEQCGDEPGERLGELASHWAAAIVSSDIAKAMHYARRAAERALEKLAPAEAVRWYRSALELYDQAPAADSTQRCELLIGLGEAQRQVGDPAYRQTLLAAAALAEELADADRLCRAVLSNSRGWVTSHAGAVDAEGVHALEAAAAALPDEDPRRAQVLAQLASELYYAGDPARCRGLAAEALQIARTAGDPTALAGTLFYAIRAIGAPDTLEQRQELSDELVELVHGLDDPRLKFFAAARRIGVALQAGDRSRVESALATIRALEASVPQPSIGWTRLMQESTLALLRGDLQASEQRAIEAFEHGTASDQPDAAMMFGGQLYYLRSFQGRLAELVEQIVKFAGEQDSLPTWRAGAALALIDSGRLDEARERALAEDFQSVRWDDTWAIAMFHWADACSRLGVLDQAAELYELLKPFSGQLASAAGLAVAGSTDWALGTLAATLERYDEAVGHYAAAVEIETRLGAPLLLARTHVGWARALIDRGQPRDLEEARPMLDRAENTAAEVGAEGITRDVVECRAALATVGG